MPEPDSDPRYNPGPRPAPEAEMAEARYHLGETVAELPFDPQRDLLVVRHLPAREASSIITTPETVENPPTEGIVLAAGPGYVNERGVEVLVPAAYAPGAHVLLPRHSGMEFEIDRKRYVLVRQDEVLGVFRRRPEVG